MDKDVILKYNMQKGLGELQWIICPVCWNHMRITEWENGTIEEECLCCARMLREMTLKQAFIGN